MKHPVLHILLSHSSLSSEVEVKVSAHSALIYIHSEGIPSPHLLPHLTGDEK